jgi:hypothetical protein
MTEHEFNAIMLGLARQFRELADEIEFEYHKWLAQQEQPDGDTKGWLTTDQPEHFNCRCSVEPIDFCYLSRDDKRRFEEIRECYERPGGYL